MSRMLIDSHCHLDVAEFDADRAQVIARAQAAGVMAQIVPAITLAGFAKLREVCARHPGLYPVYGLHPMFVAEHAPAQLDELGVWIERERPVAVGECGLDFFVEGLDRDSQRMYFSAQLEIAREFELPVIVHARHAVEEVIATLRRVNGSAHRGRALRGVVHSFSGSEEQARQLWKLGFHIGIGGPLTYDRAKRLRSIVARMPLEFLLLETDAPDQPMSGHRGQRNEPALLIEVLAAVSLLRRENIDAIAAAATTNARGLFGFPMVRR
jgi:TatD DNase family protein